MKEVKLKIDGISCDHCRMSIKNALEQNDDIKEVNVEGDIATIKFEHDLDKDKVIDKVNSIGFETKKDYFID